MNHITINKLADLQQIIDEPLFISEKKFQTDEESYHNMWAITFSDDLVKKLKISDLENLVSQLIQNRTSQLLPSKSKLPVTFYLWFDKQALQLRFNIIFKRNTSLPFNCKLQICASPETILKDFLSLALEVSTHGDNVTFFDPNDDDYDDEEEFTLNVYVKEMR